MNSQSGELALESTPLLERLPGPVNRALGVALTARLAQFVEAFLAVLLLNENGVSTATVAIVLFAQQAGATFGATVAGEFIDRRGARAATALGLLLAGGGAIALASFEWAALLIAVAAIYGLGASGWRLGIQAGIAQGLAQASDQEEASDLRSWAFGSLIWVSNAGALLSACAVIAGTPLKVAFIIQGALSVVAAVFAYSLPRWRAKAGPRTEPPRRIDRELVLIALAMAPATALMFQAFSGLAITYEHTPYLAMVVVNAVVLVLGQPLIWALGHRLPAGEFLGGATILLGVGIAAGALFEDIVASTLVWSFAELVVISLSAAVVAGLAPHDQMGRYQATFQVIQGVVAALAMLGGPLLAQGSQTDFAVACLTLGLVGVLALRLLSGLLSTALAHPVACPCGARICHCDPAHLACANPSPVIVHQAQPA